MKIRMPHLLLLVGIILLTSCGTSQSPRLTKLRINRSVNISYAPIYLADSEGYFADYGIELEMIDFEKTGDAIPLVLSGDLDAYAGAVNAGLLNALYNESNIRVVADRGKVSADMECSFIGILVRRDLYESGAIEGPEDLQGLTVVTTKAGPVTFLISSYLDQGGLTLDDVEVSALPSKAYIDAMANQTVDAIVTMELNLSRVLAAGDSVLLVGMEDAVGDYQTSVLAFGKNLLIDDPDLGARFLAAYLKGVSQYNEGKTEHNLDILSKATEQDIELLKNACWVPISQDGIPDYAAIVPFMNWSFDQGHLDQVITEDQFWAPDLLDAARDLLEE